LLQLSYPSPICALIRESAFPFIITVQNDGTLSPDEIKKLAEISPLVANILQKLFYKLPRWAFPFFDLLMEISATPFSGSLAPIVPATNTVLDYYPGLPKLRNRGSFKADKSSVIWILPFQKRQIEENIYIY